MVRSRSIPAKPTADEILIDVSTREGFNQARNSALSFLEHKYMDDSVERGSEKALAILEVAKELAAHLRVVERQFDKDKRNKK